MCISICGGFPPITKRKPKDWIDRGYQIIIPFPFKWRDNLGKVICDCKEVREVYQPYYGFAWLHSEDCAILKHAKKFPQMMNSIQRDIEVITQSE